MTTKTSILVFYLTLSKSDKVFKWTTIGTMVVVNVAGFALAMLNIFQCRPMSALFETPRPDSATCTDVITLYLSSAPVNIITDLIILLLPMPVLKALRLPRKQKIILYVTFGFGIFVTAVDVIRIAYLQQATLTRLQDLEADTKTSSRETMDFSWYASYSFMWSAIEVNVGIMCACVPALKPLVSRFLPLMLRDTGEMTPRQRGSIVTVDSVQMAAAHRVPSVSQPPTLQTHGQAGPDENDMSFTDFLTTPDMNEMPRVVRTQTAMTDYSNESPTAGRGRNFFDFINMPEQKSLVFLTNRESIKPIAQVTLLFFLWGFAYGLLNTLNSQFQIIAKMTAGESVAIHSAYFIGYLIGPPTIGRLVLKHWGFKSCYIVGLMIYGTGTLVFWPSAVLTSFPAFFISNLIVGLGLSVLEIAANSFIILCGPPEYAEIRLNLSQGVQACGSVVSPVLATKALFQNVLNAPSLIDVQWTYLAITLFTFFLAFIYHLLKVPEATDEELEEAAMLTYTPPVLDSLRRSHTIWITLAATVTAQFLYVGVQESVSTSTTKYVNITQPSADSINVSAVAHALFAASRFLAAGLGWFLHVKPAHLLLFFFTGAMVFSILCMQSSITGFSGTVMLYAVYFFEGPLFSLLYAQGLRGLGRYTKDGSAAMTCAIGGGAVWPPVIYAIARSGGTRYSFSLAIALFAVCAVLPIYLQIIPKVRTQVATNIGKKRSNSLNLGWTGRRGGLGSFGLVRRSLGASRRSGAEMVETRGSIADDTAAVATAVAPASSGSGASGSACTVEHVSDAEGWEIITRDFHPAATMAPPSRSLLQVPSHTPSSLMLDTPVSPMDTSRLPWGVNVGGCGGGADAGGWRGDVPMTSVEEDVGGQDQSRVQSWASSTTPLWRGVRKLSAAALSWRGAGEGSGRMGSQGDGGSGGSGSGSGEGVVELEKV